MADKKIIWQNSARTFSENLGYDTMHLDPVGTLLVCHSSKGICYLGILNKENPITKTLEKIQLRWPLCNLQKEIFSGTFKNSLESTLNLKMGIIDNPKPLEDSDEESLDLHLIARPFEKSVWLQLLRIPAGQTCSYGQIAQLVKNPRASRAVGNAVGNNPVSLLIPCHRVIRQDGSLGHYLWGIEQKQQLLSLEKKLSIT